MGRELAGIGELYEGEVYLGRVAYELILVQRGWQELPLGRLKPLSDEIDTEKLCFEWANLTLLLEGGQCVGCQLQIDGEIIPQTALTECLPK